MRPRNQLQAVHVVELACYLIPKQPPGPPRRNRPRLHILRVAPHQVAERTFVRDLLGASDDADLVEGADLGAQAAVHAEHFAVDDGGEDEEVEDLAASFPDGGVAVFLLALLVEAVDLGDLARFVVAADEGDAVGESGVMGLAGYNCRRRGWDILGFQAHQQGERLQAKVAAIDKVAKEDVILVAW